MSTIDPIKESKIVMEAYQYSRKNNLDIKNREDVVKILKAIDADDFSEERVDTLMIALQIIASKIRKDLERRGKIN